MPAVQPKAKMKPACFGGSGEVSKGKVEWVREGRGVVAYDDYVREAPEEEGPAEVLPESGLVLGVVHPWLQFLEVRAFREPLDERLVHRGDMRGSAEVDVGGQLGWVFGRIIGEVFFGVVVARDGLDSARVEEEAREHGLLEREEEQYEHHGVDDGDDVLRPSPAHGVGDGPARDQAETARLSALNRYFGQDVPVHGAQLLAKKIHRQHRTAVMHEEHIEDLQTYRYRQHVVC